MEQTFQQSILVDAIIVFCPTSPSAQMSQIAVANRRLNVSWRRMHYRMVKAFLQNLMNEMQRVPPSYGHTDLFFIRNNDAMLLACDLEDMI
jgi:hypothetical protein